MRVIIAGSRDIRSYPEVAQAMLDCGFDVTELVSGAAYGVDQLGERWAVRHGVPLKKFLPEYNHRITPWSARDKWNKRAPLERNKKMAEYADALVAIWNGRSTGTAHMMGCMRKLGKPVFVREVK